MDDVKIFNGLLSDMFPGVKMPIVVDSKIMQAIESVISEAGLDLNKNYHLKHKVYELHEIM